MRKERIKLSRTILPDKRIKRNIKIIDGERGYFECNNYCYECKGGKCDLIQEMLNECQKDNS